MTITQLVLQLQDAEHRILSYPDHSPFEAKVVIDGQYEVKMVSIDVKNNLISLEI